VNVLAGDIVERFQTLLWPLLRISAMLLTAPPFSTDAFNLRLRILLAAVLTWWVHPMYVWPVLDLVSAAGVAEIFNQVLIGAVMGLALQIVVAAIMVGGQAISSTMGLSMANLMDHNFGNVPVLSQFLMVLGVLVFLALGGHLLLIQTLVESFRVLPVGQSLSGTEPIGRLIGWSTMMFLGAVLLALPVPQAAELLRSAPPDDEVARLASIVEGRAMRPAWVAMTRLRTGMELPFDRLLLEADESIASVIDQGSKPGSDSPRGRDLVLEATTAWTEAHLELPAEEVATRLGMALERVLRARGVAASIESVVAHRWRFAAPRMTLDPRVEAWSAPLAIGAAGDWCGEGTIASAFAAGEGLAGRVLGESRFFVAAPATLSGEAARGLFDLSP